MRLLQEVMFTMFIFGLALIVILLTGCAADPYWTVAADQPKSDGGEFIVAQMPSECAGYVGCTIIDKKSRVATSFILKSLPPLQLQCTSMHEELHRPTKIRPALDHVDPRAYVPMAWACGYEVWPVSSALNVWLFR
jgi:hypothetical protein